MLDCFDNCLYVKKNTYFVKIRYMFSNLRLYNIIKHVTCFLILFYTLQETFHVLF